MKISKEMDEFINKLDSLCWEYQMEIKPTHPVPDDEWWKLKIAHSHYLTGEGAEELYDVCKKLSKKYCN